jgi:hypothetical protein
MNECCAGFWGLSACHEVPLLAITWQDVMDSDSGPAVGILVVPVCDEHASASMATAVHSDPDSELQLIALDELPAFRAAAAFPVWTLRYDAAYEHVA